MRTGQNKRIAFQMLIAFPIEPHTHNWIEDGPWLSAGGSRLKYLRWRVSTRLSFPNNFAIVDIKKSSRRSSVIFTTVQMASVKFTTGSPAALDDVNILIPHSASKYGPVLTLGKYSLSISRRVENRCVLENKLTDFQMQMPVHCKSFYLHKKTRYQTATTVTASMTTTNRVYVRVGLCRNPLESFNGNVQAVFGLFNETKSFLKMS